MTGTSAKPFRSKQFTIEQSNSSMKVGTDAALLGCWTDCASASSILDVGTGTGVIALICAQRNQKAGVDAVEIDHGSLVDASHNFSHSPWPGRLRAFGVDFLRYQPDYKYDLIISNPPYFSDSIRALDPVRSMARHDDSLPADKFMVCATAMLMPEGWVSIIIPAKQLQRWIDAGEEVGLHPRRICHVFTLPGKGAQRVMTEFSFCHTGEPQMESVLIERSPGEFSEAYKHLTREFFTRW